MRERPMLFSAEMVRALLTGTKTQTRRPVRSRVHTAEVLSEAQSVHQDGGGNWIFWSGNEPELAAFTKLAYPNGEGIPCPYGRVGGRLWCRETYRVNALFDDGSVVVQYRADDAKVTLEPDGEIWDTLCERYGDLAARMGAAEDGEGWLHLPEGQHFPWVPSILLPKWACRLWLEIVSVRVERLSAISEADAQAEGTSAQEAEGLGSYRAAYMALWARINGPQSVQADPWVWVVEFRRVEQ